MSKAILISIKPKWVAKILNGEKTIEVRKNKALASAIQKLIDEYGYAEIYVYCSKDEYLYRTNKGYIASKKPLAVGKGTEYTFAYSDEGKVLFKFRCYKVEEKTPFEEFESPFGMAYKLTGDKVACCYKACLSYNEYNHYLKGKNGYAIHISDLEIFYRPKELSEFRYATCPQTNCEYCKYNKTVDGDLYCTRQTLTQAPQNFCYVEVEEK